MKIFTWDDPSSFNINVVFVFGEKGEVRTAFNFATNVMFTIRPGDQFPPEAVMKVPRDIFDEMLKGFAEMANDKGLKLDSDLKREGILEATNRHLEDMRTLVFKGKK